MKKIVFAAIGIATITAFGCKKIQELTEFDIPFNTSFTVPAQVPGTILPDIQTPGIQTNIQKTFESNGTAKDLIDEVTLKEMKLVVNTPTTGTLNFLKSAKIYINAKGMSEALLSSRDSIPRDVNTIDFTTSSANLTNYITKDSFSLRIQVVTRELTNTSTKIDVKTKFHVNAKILGQ